MKFKYQTIPPECQNCGLIDSPDRCNPVDTYPDNEPDPKWPTWLCIDCRVEQWHESGSSLSLREYLGQGELEHKLWVEGNWDGFLSAYLDRFAD